MNKSFKMHSLSTCLLRLCVCILRVSPSGEIKSNKKQLLRKQELFFWVNYLFSSSHLSALAADMRLMPSTA